MIIVTGAVGFIGSCFIQRLNQENFNTIIAVDKFESAINPQINPHQIITGINEALKSSMFPWRFANILARLAISANLAKSDGWKD